MARLFVAVDVPPAVRERLSSWARGAAAALADAGERKGRSLRLLDPGALHLTLCFLGSRPVEEIAPIGRSLDACPAHLGELSVGAPLWLPPARPRALAISVHDDGELARLHAAVARAICEETGAELKRARFRAHITVARLRGRQRTEPRSIGAGHPLAPTPQIRFTAESITLYRSWLTPGGATYEVLASRRVLPAEL